MRLCVCACVCLPSTTGKLQREPSHKRLISKNSVRRAQTQEEPRLARKKKCKTKQKVLCWLCSKQEWGKNGSFAWARWRIVKERQKVELARPSLCVSPGRGFQSIPAHIHQLSTLGCTLTAPTGTERDVALLHSRLPRLQPTTREERLQPTGQKHKPGGPGAHPCADGGTGQGTAMASLVLMLVM